MGEVKKLPIVTESLESMLNRLDALENRNTGGGSGMVDERVPKLEIIADFMREDLADIKKDMRESSAALKEELRASRVELKEEMRASRAEFKEEMREFRVGIKEDMRVFRTEMKKDMCEFRDEVKEEVKGVRSDNKTTRTTVVITGISVVLGVGGIIGGMLYSIAQIQTSWLTSVAQILNK